MPNPSYPNIPLPSQSLGSEVSTPVSRTAMEGGQARQIAKFSTGQKTYSCQWSFTSLEYEEFLSFFYTTLNNGVDFFEITLPTETGFDTLTVRFVGGRISDSYRSFDNWNVSATLESFINQVIEAPDTPLDPIWYQPEREIFIDTTIDARFANNLLLCQPSTGETIVITVPEVLTPSDWLPFGIINKGPGNVTVRLQEPLVEPEPSDTWMALAASMGAWGIYRFDTGAVFNTGRLVEIADLSANGNDLKDTHATALSRAVVTGGWVRANNADNSAFRGFRVNGSNESIMNLPNYHVLAVQRIILPAETGAILTTAQQISTIVDPVTSIDIATTPGRWAMHHNSVNGGIATDKNFPTSGTTPRLTEIVSYDTNDSNILIDGRSVVSLVTSNQPMNCLQLGGRFNKDAFTPNVETAAVVIFSDTTNFDTIEAQINLAFLRDKMLSDFS